MPLSKALAHEESCPVDLSFGPGEIHSATHRGGRARLRNDLDNEIVCEEREFCSKFQIDLPIKHGLGKVENHWGALKMF